MFLPYLLKSDLLDWSVKTLIPPLFVPLVPAYMPTLPEPSGLFQRAFDGPSQENLGMEVRRLMDELHHSRASTITKELRLYRTFRNETWETPSSPTDEALFKNFRKMHQELALCWDFELRSTHPGDALPHALISRVTDIPKHILCEYPEILHYFAEHGPRLQDFWKP